MAEEQLNIWYESPPRMVGGEEVAGQSFHLSGSSQGAEGVELARGLSGLFRVPRDYRYDTTANQPGSTFVDSVANRRRFEGAINILGENPTEFHKAARGWLEAHPDHIEGKLWVSGPSVSARYAYVRSTTDAGISSMDIDPNLTGSLTDFTWGWESDFPYFFGPEETVNYSTSGSISVVNPSTAGWVYPRVYLEGPGVYAFNGVTTPNLTADETIRINFDPERPTYVKRNNKTGHITNLWYTLVGKRPRLQFRPGEKIEHKITKPSESSKAYMKFIPLYEGAF